MLDQYHWGIIQCEQERGQWVCWVEDNDLMDIGVERLCGSPTQLNDVLAGERRVWQVDLLPSLPASDCQEGGCIGDCRMGWQLCRIGGHVYWVARPTLPTSGAPLAL